MAYTASQNPKTGTTYTAAALFATLILFAGIAALATHPAEAFATPLCAENGPCYAGVNTNASAADGARSLCNGICDNYENGLCPGKGPGHGSGCGWSSGSGAQNGNAYGYGSGNGYGACANGNGCGYAHSHGHGACIGFVDGCQRAQKRPNR